MTFNVQQLSGPYKILSLKVNFIFASRELAKSRINKLLGLQK